MQPTVINITNTLNSDSTNALANENKNSHEAHKGGKND